MRQDEEAVRREQRVPMPPKIQQSKQTNHVLKRGAAVSTCKPATWAWLEGIHGLKLPTMQLRMIRKTQYALKAGVDFFFARMKKLNIHFKKKNKK